MRILIADDHILIRAGIKQLIESLDEDYQVVAEASSGTQINEQLEQHHIDVVLLDISMPELNGLDSLKQIKEYWPETLVIMLSMHSDKAHVQAAITSGADGFLVKDSAPAELEIALRYVMQGQKYISPRVSTGMVDALLEAEKLEKSGPTLSPRQQEILGLISEGYSTKEIAGRLDLSVKTIETHRSRMMETLGLNRGPELLRYALRHNQQNA